VELYIVNSIGIDFIRHFENVEKLTTLIAQSHYDSKPLLPAWQNVLTAGLLGENKLCGATLVVHVCSCISTVKS